MKPRKFFCFLAALVIVFVISAGCTAPSPSQPLPSPTQTPAPVTATTPLPIETTPALTIPTSLPPTPAVTTPQPISSEDIALHFMDIAFGSGNTQLDRLPYNPTAQKPRNTLSLFNGDTADLALIESFVNDFNDLSATTQFSTNIKTTSTADIVLQFVSQTGMDAIDKDRYSKVFKSGGVSFAKIGTGTIYINGDLKGDQRSHIILRSLLYELGFKGESLKYPDSIFYYQDNTNTQLSLIDRKAIQIMYGAGLYPGMTVSDVKNVVYVKTN
jgi:hypothetical protein